MIFGENIFILTFSYLELQQVHSENQKLRAELDHLRQEHQRQMEQAEKRFNNLIGDYDRGREVSGREVRSDP